MRWSAQVAHVARKDLRMTVGYLAAYSAVVAVAGGVAAGWIAPSTSWLWGLGVLLLGTVWVAAVVQADSPWRSDAYWAGLPLHATAVFAAKLAVAGVIVVGIGLAGQLAGLLAYQVAAADLPGLLARSALAYAVSLATAAVIAALTRDLRTFVLVLILETLAGFLVPAMYSEWRVDAGGAVAGEGEAVAAKVLFVLAALAVVLYLYRTRNRGRAIGLTALLLVATWLAPAVRPPREPAGAGEAPIHLRTPVVIRPFPQRTRGLQVGVRLLGGERSHGYALTVVAAYVQVGDGDLVPVAVRRSPIHLNEPVPALGEGIEWEGRDGAASEFTTTLDMGLTPEQRDAVASGTARVVVKGRVELLEPRVAVSLPLRTGASAVVPGRRFGVREVGLLAAGGEVEIGVSQVSGGRDEAWPRRSMFLPEYVLVNEATGQAVPMRHAGGSGSGFGLVLPGADSWSETVRLKLEEPAPGGDGPRFDEEWLGGARLLVLDWVPVGGYPVTASIAAEADPGPPGG